jgi:hypothetical protein
MPQCIPLGYISYFVLPAVISVYLARWWSSKFQWREPIMLLTCGLTLGTVYAFVQNAYLCAKYGICRYGHAIEGLVIRAGTIYQYPLYECLTMGVTLMVLTYFLGRTDLAGRTLIEVWADSKAKSALGSAFLSIIGFIIVGNVTYLLVFAPNLATKVLHLQTVAAAEELYAGVPNQPF